MDKKYLFLDFEFNRVSEPFVNLVSCVTIDSTDNKPKKFWLHNDFTNKNKVELKNYLVERKDTHIFVSYASVAEFRSMLAIGLNVLEFKMIDLFFEYRCLTNHNDDIQWGNQLVDGKVKIVKKPVNKWKKTEDDEVGDSFKATHSLAEASYKLLGVIRDTEHKTRMRDLIISNPSQFSSSEKESILSYGVEDVADLPSLLYKMVEKYGDLDTELSKEDIEKDMLLRGKYGALTAMMENTGYPIDVEKTRNFTRQIPSIIMECQEDINNQFPDIKPFKWDRLRDKYKWDQKITREWVSKNCDVDKWEKTDKGELSLALDAFTKSYDYKHDYPRGNFGAQIVRFLKLKQSLNGFAISPNKRSFWDSVGSDGRVRAYLNPFGAQSSRTQPAATGFMFLKPAWMRALVVPPKGKFMAGIDYGSQEFFISALESADSDMIKAYLSGDPYLAFAKLINLVPKDGTKEQYKFERDLCKSTTLGLSYDMSKTGLSVKLTADLGKEFTEEQAQEQINLFFKAYPDFKKYKFWNIQEYKRNKYIRLRCGWYMWGDNENMRSVGNVPIQGLGASIMRKAVEFATVRGCTVVKTLHDAIYIEENVGEEYKIDILREAMVDAFAFYFTDDDNGDNKTMARKIRLDPFAWSQDYTEENKNVIVEETKKGKNLYVMANKWKVPCSDLYIDERAESEYEKFSKYFELREESEL